MEVLSEAVTTLKSRLSCYENHHNDEKILSENAFNSTLAEVSELKSSVERLSRNEDILKQSAEESAKKLTELQEMLSMRDEALLSRTNELQNMEKKLEFQKTDYEKLIRDKETEINFLRESVDKAVVDYDANEKLQHMNHNLINNIDSTLLVINATNSYLKDASSEICELKLGEFIPEDSGLRTELECLVAAVQEIVEKKRNIEQDKQKMHILGLEVDEYAKSSTNLKQLVLQKDSQVASLSEELSKEQNITKELQSNIESLNEKSNKMKQLLVRLKKELSDKDKLIENARKQEQEANGNLIQAEQKLSKVISNQSRDTGIVDTLRNSVDALHEELATKSRQSERQLDSISKSRDLLKVQLESLKEEFAEYKVKAETALSFQSDQSALVDEYERILSVEREEHSKLRDKCQVNEIKLPELQSSISLLQNQREMLQQQITNLQKQLKTEADQYSTKIDRMEQEMDQLKVTPKVSVDESFEQRLKQNLEKQIRQEVEQQTKLECNLRISQLESDHRYKLDALVERYETQITALHDKLSQAKIRKEQEDKTPDLLLDMSVS
ncbi:hypothetical protein Ciccas_001052 [Cichlidogyrus casuarinus]|uniref:Uncharacterized protein n=1 Tax=Cichlidogyrus casuarinus TaxID=1844966 RepID=A0ABD2QL67_9PLAT